MYMYIHLHVDVHVYTSTCTCTCMYDRAHKIIYMQDTSADCISNGQKQVPSLRCRSHLSSPSLRRHPENTHVQVKKQIRVRVTS